MKGAGLTADDFEAELFRLQRKAQGLEASLEERSAQLRAAERRAAALEQAKRELSAKLDLQQRQVKVGIKRYEELLGCAEEVVVFAWRFAAGVVEVLERALESLACQRETDLAAVWTQAVPASEAMKMRRSLAVLTGSRRLQSRNLFASFRANAGFDSLLNIANVQQQLRRIGEGGGRPARLSAVGTRGDIELSSSRVEQLDFSQVIGGSECKNPADLFVTQAKTVVEWLGTRPPPLLTSEMFAAIAEQTQRLDRALRGHLQLAAQELREVMPLEPLPEHKACLQAREAAQRLNALRDTLEHLLHQRGQAAETAAARHFGLLEVNQLIIALERDVERRVAEAGEKEHALQRLQGEADCLEAKLEQLMRERIEHEETSTALTLVRADLIEGLRRVSASQSDLESFAGKLLEVEAEALNAFLAQPSPPDLAALCSVLPSPVEEQLRGRIAARLLALRPARCAN